MDTVLVTGSGGQLGRALRAAGKAVGGSRFIFSDLTCTGDEETLCLDITDEQAVGMVCRSEKVNVIVNCAAYTDVAAAEKDTYLADLVNNKAAAGLARVAASCGASLIHISTDYVFDGKSSLPYGEDASPAPLNVYGATKLLGEVAITNSGCRYLIVRTAWLYSLWGRNFYRTVSALSASRPYLTMVSDQVGSPTYAPDLAAFICRVLSGGPFKPGIVNYSGAGVASWYDFACGIIRLRSELLGAPSCDVKPCSSDDYPAGVRRPAYSVLDKSKAARDFGAVVPHWYDSLRRCVLDEKSAL